MDCDFARCRSLLDPAARRLFDRLLTTNGPNELLAALTAHAVASRVPPFLADLFRLEQAVARVRAAGDGLTPVVDRLLINPTLELVPVGWAGLDLLFIDGAATCQLAAGTFVMVWQSPVSRIVHIKQAADVDLLALKIVADELNPEVVATQAGGSVAVADSSIRHAVDQGLILRPPSAICRHWTPAEHRQIDPKYLRAEVVTLQWHITQACDLHCRHCYDRSSLQTMPLAQGLTLLDEFRAFCQQRFVHGQVTFTGGNPLLYPHFLEVYRGAVERGLGVAILGNPAPRRQLEAVIAIAKPLYFQVSLEGLAEHNDYIRGEGHFARVMTFLALLRELHVYSMVMLTLTRANQEQVLALAEHLRDKADLFTFNRLAMVGEGANLMGPEVGGYQHFLRKYLDAAQGNLGMGIKDNLFNLLACREAGGRLFGGCAGHGCGAAFNFVSVLADGEVHACRKFPSAIGNAFRDGFATVYDSARADAYRQGSAACQGCRIRPLCGGCLAVVHGMGLDPLRERDPYCWQG